MQSKYIVKFAMALALMWSLTGCYDVNQKADPNDLKGNNAGVEYAPQMYHSEPYDPMSQIKDTTAGLSYWPFEKVGTKEELGGRPHGEWYNSNYWNPYEMNMRQPNAASVMRGEANYYWPDSVDVKADNGRQYSHNNVMNPYVPSMAPVISEAGDTLAAMSDEAVEYVAQGKELYGRFCQHCHGAQGGGDGKVAEKFAGVANLQAVQTKSSGYIFHVITFGKNNMRPHAALIDDDERWKIAEYVLNDIVE